MQIQIATNITDLQYECVLRECEEAELWPALAAFGFDYAEIQRHVDDRRLRMEQGFVY